MKTKLTYLALLCWLPALLLLSKQGVAQYEVFLTSKKKSPDKLKVVDKTTQTSKSVAGLKSGKAFVIRSKSLKNTLLVSNGISVFRLERPETKQTTGWIGLQSNESLSLENCFLRKSDQGNGSEYYASVFSGYSATERSTLMRSGNVGMLQFDQKTPKAFFSPQDFNFSWKTQLDIKNISIRGLTSIGVLFVETDYSDSTLTYGHIKKFLEKNQTQFETGNLYQLRIRLANGDEKVYSHTFALEPLVFQTPNRSSFLVPDSVAISWKAASPPAKIELCKNAEKQTLLWQSSDFEGNQLTYQELKQALGENFRGQYLLKVYPRENPRRAYPLSFEVVFKSIADFQEAKALLESE